MLRTRYAYIFNSDRAPENLIKESMNLMVWAQILTQSWFIMMPIAAYTKKDGSLAWHIEPLKRKPA